MLWRLMLVFGIVHAAWGIGFWAEVFSLFVGRLVKKR